jgi:hypothetical protein
LAVARCRRGGGRACGSFILDAIAQATEEAGRGAGGLGHFSELSLSGACSNSRSAEAKGDAWLKSLM